VRSRLRLMQKRHAACCAVHWAADKTASLHSALQQGGEIQQQQCRRTHVHGIWQKPELLPGLLSAGGRLSLALQHVRLDHDIRAALRYDRQ
jgi:hypothetical protein